MSASRRQITVTRGGLPVAREQLIEALRASSRLMFLQGSRLVRPKLVTRENPDGRRVEILELAPIQAAEFRIECDAVARFQRAKPTDDFQLVNCDCPPVLAASVHEAPHSGAFDRIERLSEAPLFIDGQVVSAPGLHRGTFLQCTPIELPPLTREYAADSLDRVRDLLAECNFATPRDECAALALLLTAPLRASLAQAPGFVLSKSQYGAGATTIAKLASILATGREPGLIAATGDPAELDKQLATVLLQARAIVVLDNLPEGRDVRSALLAQALSEPLVTVRELGHSRSHEIDTGRLFILTGVNVRSGRDLQRRTLNIGIASPGEFPERRTFKRPHLLREVIAGRQDILRDLYTIIAAYAASGAHEPTAPLAGFEAWAQLIIAPLVWLGRPDPIAEVHERAEADEVRQTLAALLPALPSEPFTVKSLLRNPLANKALDILGEALGVETAELTPRKVGGYFRARKGRPVNGYTLTECGTTDGAARWLVTRPEGVKGSKGSESLPFAREVGNSRVVGVGSEPLRPLDPFFDTAGVLQ